jgi:hypothetical protein
MENKTKQKPTQRTTKTADTKERIMMDIHTGICANSREMKKKACLYKGIQNSNNFAML